MHLKRTAENIWTLKVSQLRGTLVGLVFFIAGVAGTLYMAIPQTLSCQDKQNGVGIDCRLTHPLLASIGLKTQFTTVEKAKLIYRTENDGDRGYSIRLYTPEGKYFIAKSFNTNRAEVNRIKNKINQYLKSEQQSSISIPSWAPLGARLVCGFFIPFSLVFLYICAARLFTIDLMKGKMFLSKKLLALFTIGSPKSYQLSDITSFEVESGTSAKYGTNYQIIANLNNGSSFAINTLVEANKQKQEQLALELNNILKQFANKGRL